MVIILSISRASEAKERAAEESAGEYEMGILKRCLNRVICPTLLAILVMNAPISAFAKTTSLSVVSIGDSIARGYGCNAEEAYGYLLADQLRDDASLYNTVIFQNFGTDGDTTANCLSKLNDATIYEPVKRAGMITISIGGNDLMQGLITEVALAYNLDPHSPKLKDEIVAKFQNITTSNVISKLSPLFSMTKEDKSLTRMAAIETTFEQNTKAILDRIFALNSDAIVLITTIPNPTKDIKLGSLIDVYLNKYNAFIRNGCDYKKGCVRIADCDQAFRDYTGTKALTFTRIDWSNLAASNFDPHPTPFGHSLMEQVHYTSLTTDTAATTASNVTTSNGSTTANTASKTATAVKSPTSITTDVPDDPLTVSTTESSDLSVDDIENTTLLTTNSESSVSDTDTASSKNNGGLIMMIILSLLVLAAVGGFVFYNLGRKKNSEKR